MSKTGKKIITTICCVIIVLALISIVAIGYMNNMVDKIKKEEINSNEISINEKVEEELNEYRNIAIFGLDSRESNLKAGNRSDCIIILSINDTKKQIKVLSVYRDTYVDIEGYGLDKINHAYSYGGAKLAINTLNRNLDLNIKEFITVNFESLAKVVNNLDGIELEISKEEMEYINESVEANSNIIGMESSKLASYGKVRLDGVQTVVYSRIRSTSGGDFKRTERMRNVLEALLDKVKNTDIITLTKIANSIFQDIYTNINSKEILEIFPSLFEYKILESIGWPYEIKEITLDQWYGVPVTLEQNVTKLHKKLFGENNYEPSKTVKDISSTIIDKTGYE